MRALALVVLLPAALPAQRPLSQASVGELLEALVDEQQGAGAQLELRRRGSAAAAGLGDRLLHGWDGHPRERIGRAAAARVLIDLGPRATPALPPLLQCVRDQHLPAEVIGHAAQAMIRIVPFGEQREPLLRALQGGAGARIGGVYRRLGRWLDPLTEALAVDPRAPAQDLLDHLAGDGYGSATACRALAARAPEWRHERTSIVAALRERVDAAFDEGRDRVAEAQILWLRTEAAMALREYAPDDPRTLLAWCQQLYDLDPALRLEAIDVLVARRAPDAARWLFDMALGAPPDVAAAALDAIARIGPRARYLAPRMAEFEGAEAEVAAAARRTLALLAPEARPIAPVFETLSTDFSRGSRVDLDAERARLLAWLDADGGRHRALLEHEARHIEAFHALPATEGGPSDPDIRWVPIRTAPDPFRPGHWAAPVAGRLPGVVLAAPAATVGPDLERLRPAPWFVELIPTDRQGLSLGPEHHRQLERAGLPDFVRVTFFGEGAARFRHARRRLTTSDGVLLHLVDGLAVHMHTVLAAQFAERDFAYVTTRPGAEDRAHALLR